MLVHTRRAFALLVLCAATVTATCDGPGTEPPAGPNVTLSVRSVTGRPIGTIQATWRSLATGAEARALVGPTGFVQLTLPESSGPGELILDGVPPRPFHPFLMPLSVAELQELETVDLVLIPRQWRIERGIYAGQIVDIPLDPVVEDEADQTFMTYFFGQPEPRANPDRYRMDLYAWPVSNTPVPTTFDHVHGVPMSPGDSAAIWASLDRLEEVLGIDLFEPAVAQADWWPDPPTTDPGYRPGVLRVVYDQANWRGVPRGLDSLATVAGELGASANGGRFGRYEVHRRLLDGGLLRIGALEPLRLADGLIPWETVLHHEVLHVLGVGHTFRMASTQGPRMRTPEPSPLDVAYMEMLRALLELEATENTLPAMIPAIAGERRLILGLPALPTLQ